MSKARSPLAVCSITVGTSMVIGSASLCKWLFAHRSVCKDLFARSRGGQRMHEARITRTVELPAPAEEVWRSLTEPELLGEWMGSVVELDVRPGGSGVIVEGDGAVRRAQVDEVDPARRLALRWWPEGGDGPEATVELELEPMPDGTRLVVTETVAGPASESASASACASARWGVRILLLGCCLLRA